jgi:hypothetical protein
MTPTEAARCAGMALHRISWFESRWKPCSRKATVDVETSLGVLSFCRQHGLREAKRKSLGYAPIVPRRRSTEVVVRVSGLPNSIYSPPGNQSLARSLNDDADALTAYDPSVWSGTITRLRLASERLMSTVSSKAGEGNTDKRGNTASSRLPDKPARAVDTNP